jgi:CDP-diacylglycerol--serine O-phosphatidyltransferase
MRKVYILPNAFTAASMFCGVFACFEIFDANPQHAEVNPQLAIWLIFAAAFLDVLDGAIARLTRSASAFGIHFDSIADVVSFGVAPALLVYSSFDVASSMLAAAVSSLYAVCGALRLARFNVQATREERKSFVGLPVPAAALAVVSLVWIFQANPSLHAFIQIDKVLPPAMVVLAYLMVSKIPFHGPKSLPIAERQPFEILVTLVVIGCLFVMLKRHLDALSFILAWGYILTSLGFSLRPARGEDASARTTSAPARNEP